MSSETRILVVDDNRSVVRLIEALLQKEGFEVLTAFDGLEGLQKAREEKPDLMILDIVMPRMDGYEVCRLLQDDHDTAAIPVLILTVKGQVDEPGIGDQDVEARVREQMAGYEAGAVDFLSSRSRRKSCWNGCGPCSGSMVSLWRTVPGSAVGKRPMNCSCSKRIRFVVRKIRRRTNGFN